MKSSLRNLAKALFDEGILLIEDQDGLLHLFHYPEREKISEFHDFHALVVGVETSIQGKSDDLLKWLDSYWEEHFEKVNQKASSNN